MTKPYPHIVNINGLADAFGCSPLTLKTEWRDYPHFYIGRGRGKNSRSARFNIEDVLAYLANRDYTESMKEIMRRQQDLISKPVKKNRLASPSKLGISRGQKKDHDSDDRHGLRHVRDYGDPLNLLSGLDKKHSDPHNLLSYLDKEV